MRNVHVLAVLAWLAAGLTPALAQQPAPANPASVASDPPPTTIKRWVDAHGQVHYSDTPPRHAYPINEVGQIHPSTPAQEAQAEAQLQQYRDYLHNPAAQPSEATFQAAAPAGGYNYDAQPADVSCAEQWARFNAAAACADQGCPAIPQPQCPPPEVWVPLAGEPPFFFSGRYNSRARQPSGTTRRPRPHRPLPPKTDHRDHPHRPPPAQNQSSGSTAARPGAPASNKPAIPTGNESAAPASNRW